MKTADRTHDPLDAALITLDRALKAVFSPAKAARPSPATEIRESATLSAAERRESAALMRVNHSGEVAAQALYHGQASFARDGATRDLLLQAAREEADHLAWCEARLGELEARPSLLAPLWYAGSFAIGDTAPVYFSNQDSATLTLLSDGPVLQSINLTNAALTNTSPVVSVASTAGLVAGIAVTGTGIPAGATVLSVDSATQFTLNVPATTTTSGQTIVVAATAIGSKVVTLATTSGLQPGMSISAPGVYPGSVIVSIDSANR
ncbi:MAG: hypothetical protein EBR51_09550, partial [Gammaproteobacteria bacterium]|nr:hypothetical protein [Gammaproteobacteria bacterium]